MSDASYPASNLKQHSKSVMMGLDHNMVDFIRQSDIKYELLQPIICLEGTFIRPTDPVLKKAGIKKTEPFVQKCI